MTHILVTNDDGYKSSGYIPLVKTLQQDYIVTAVAPNRERSWIGKAITIRKNLTVKPMRRSSIDCYIVNGTPADCVQIGMHHVLDTYPDLVVSGINLGENVGHARMLSSGTIGAAMEASFEGVPALAVSLSIPVERKKQLNLYSPCNYHWFQNAAEITRKLASIILKNPFTGIDFVSINIPPNATVDSELEITRPFHDPYGSLFHRTREGFLHRTPPLESRNLHEGTDYYAVCKGRISLTPISLSLVSDQSLAAAETKLKNKW